MWLVVEKYFKILYTNGSTEADNLSIQVHLSTDGSIFLAHQLDGTILDETESIVTRSVLTGLKDDGTYNNFGFYSDAVNTISYQNADVDALVNNYGAYMAIHSASTTGARSKVNNYGMRVDIYGTTSPGKDMDSMSSTE